MSSLSLVGPSHPLASYAPHHVSVSVPRRSTKNVAGEINCTSAAPNMHREDLQVCKKFLHPAQKIADHAAGMAAEMVRREARGSGDIPNAMERLERRHGLPTRTLWNPRYRPPKRLFADVYEALKAAYRAEIERQHKALSHELAIAATLAGADSYLVRAAAAVAGESVPAPPT